MKQITLARAFQILLSADGLLTVFGSVNYGFSELNESDENEFLYFGWQCDGSEHSTKFAQGANTKVRISGASLFLIDTEGEQWEITILQKRNLEKEFDEWQLF